MFHLLLQFCPFFFCQLTPGHVYATPSSGSFRRSMAQSDGVARQHAFAELGMAAVTYLQDWQKDMRHLAARSLEDAWSCLEDGNVQQCQQDLGVQ